MGEMIKELLHQRIDRRRQLVAAGVTCWHEVMGDEYIDYMAERFQRLMIREYTHATFEQYLEMPEYYEGYLDALKCWKMVQFDEGTPGILNISG